MKKLLFPLVALLACSVINAEEITVGYQYDGNHRTDFANNRYGLTVGEFTDARGVDNPNLITSADLGNGLASDGYSAEKPISELIRDALIQGFQHGNANMDSEEAMTVRGSLNQLQAQVMERDGVATIRLTLRVNLELVNGNRTIWQTNLFGRGDAPVADGMAAAMHAALNRMVRELVRDDYFLLELR